MSSDKKSGSHSHKQRKKSPGNFVIHHESPEISSALQNGHSVSPFSNHQESMKSVSSSKEPGVNVGITPPMQQRPRLSSGSVDGDSHPNTQGWVSSRKVSRTQSESGSHTKSVAFALPENDEVFCDTNSSSLDLTSSTMLGEMASLHRPVCIEEELYAKVNQLNSLVLLWRKRWKQQKDCSDGLVQQIQYTKQECTAMVENMKETYTQKVQSLYKDLNKEIKERKRLEHEQVEMAQRLTKTTEEKDSERRSWKDMLRIKDEEVIVGLSKQEEARTTIRVIKKELSKVKRENEKLVRHIAKLRNHISGLEERQVSSPPAETLNCNGQCEHKVLFELAIERVRFYDDILCHRNKSKSDSSRYVLKTSPDDPLNMSVESTQDQHSSDDVFNDSHTKCSVTSSCSSSQEGHLPLITYLPDDPEVEESLSLQNCYCKSCNNNNNYCSDSHQFSDRSADTPNGHFDISSNSSPRPTTLGLHPDFGDVDHSQECLDTSTNSDSALSAEGDPLHLHLPLCKCLTSDTSSPKKSSSLARSKTWLVSRADSPFPESGNRILSPGDNDHHEGHSNGHHHHSITTSSPRLVRSGFEGLRERRNGITDTKLDASLQLKLSKSRKSHEFSDLLKKFSFHTGTTADTGVKDRDNSAILTTVNNNNTSSTNKKTGFMNLGVSMLTRKKSNSLKDM